MLVAEEVRGGDGQVLAAAGATLSQRHLELFRTRGVAMVAIDDVNGPVPVIDPVRLTRAQRIVARRFAGQPVKHPLIQELFRIAVERELLLEGAR